MQNIKGQILYFGSPLNFNDPYDCALTPNIKSLTDEEAESLRNTYLAQESQNEALRKELKALPTHTLRELLRNVASKTFKESTDTFLKTKGVACFSEKHDDLLMWSHYGGRYRGICLEFDSRVEPFNRAIQVNYVTTFPEINVASILVDKDFDHVPELYCTKSKSWAYEYEWRALHNVAGTQYIYRPEALTGVYFGPDIDNESLEIVCLVLSGQNEHVRFYKGSRSTTEFKVLFEEFNYTSYLEAKRMGLRE